MRAYFEHPTVNRANPIRAETKQPLSSHPSHSSGDRSNNSSSSSFHLRSSLHPLYRTIPLKTDISFQCEEMQQTKSYGKIQIQKGNIYFYRLFLKEDLRLGVALDLEFSRKVYLMLKHDPSLKLIKIFSIHISALLFSAAVVHFWVNNWTYSQSAPINHSADNPRSDAKPSLEAPCPQDRLECY